MPLPLIPPVWTSAGPPYSVTPAPVVVLAVVGTAVGSAGPVDVDYPNPADEPGYELRLVNMVGDVLVELPHANAETITRELNKEPELVFESPKHAPETAEISPLAVEVQAHRNGKIRFFGPVVDDQAESSNGAIGYNARGAWWYFRRRFFGTAGRTSKLWNGDFELGLSGWRAVGTTPDVVTVADSPFVEPLTGSKALLFFTGAGENRYVAQRRFYRTDYPPGQRITVAGWVYLHTFTGPAAFGLGLLVTRIVGGKIVRQANAPIDASTPVGEWTRLETSLGISPFEDGILDVRLFAPGGITLWDSAVAVLNESTGTSYPGNDQTELARRVVRYAQTGEGKSDVRVGTRTPPSGKVISKAFRHEAHEPIVEAIEGLAAAPDGFDFSVEITDRTRTFVTHYPRQGTDRRGEVVLKLGPPSEGGNLSHYSRGRDGSSVANSVVAKGPGDGPDREEGGSIDASALDGLILEEVVTVPDGVSVGELDEYAAAERQARDDVIPVLELTTHNGAGDLVDLLDVGDLVDVEIDDGAVQVDTAYRIVKIVERCRTESLVVTGNVWTGP